MHKRDIINTIVVGLLICFTISSCSTPRYGGAPESYFVQLDSAFNRATTNKIELLQALKKAPKEQKEAMAFLIANMPQSDLTTIKAAFLLENVALAYKAREKYPWAAAVPQEIFFNDVLPYASMNERRDNWRGDFFTRFSKYVEGAKDIRAAIDSVNFNIKSEVNVEYNTDREKPDQSPYESMEQNMASCSGLSILLTDAFRAVGIPSRIAGTVNWWDNRGNHNWSEVYVDGRWYFTEFYHSGLDKGWFLSDAGRADKSDVNHAIWATSWKQIGGPHFPMVWDLKSREVPGVNVTDRYIEVYQAAMERNPLKDDETILNIDLLKEEACTPVSSNRFQTNISVYLGDKVVASGTTPGENDDLNQYLKLKLKREVNYHLVFQNERGERIEKEITTEDEKLQKISLYLK